METYRITYDCDRPWPQEMMDYVMPILLLVLLLVFLVYLGLLMANEWKRRHTLDDAQELLRKHKADTE